MNAITTSSETVAKPNSQTRKRGCLFYIKRGLLALLIIVVALPVLGMIYQTAATESDRRTYPAPGQRVDVGGW